jgi:hypothetical protein
VSPFPLILHQREHTTTFGYLHCTDLLNCGQIDFST